ncbi:unnamed protein product, partial [Prorocentrum cordatum]
AAARGSMSAAEPGASPQKAPLCPWAALRAGGLLACCVPCPPDGTCSARARGSGADADGAAGRCGGAGGSSASGGRRHGRFAEDEDHALALALSTEEDLVSDYVPVGFRGPPAAAASARARLCGPW